MEWMILPYRRYAEFTGRSRRKEYWMFVLFQVLVSLAIGVVFGRTSYMTGAGMMTGNVMVQGPGGMVQNLFSLVSLIPGIAVSVRRLHDQDRSGWLLLLALIPFLGWFALLVFMCLEGTRGPNRFGPDPKNPTDLEAF
ncbi:MAG TPA: DUF805 domain-containing protein [Novosphingobium sp.]|jgi:uncharacterized membrane protein YhaH (DUF805 family)|nr:DUF805 domain-containing protein [Novosphingobium sp.]